MPPRQCAGTWRPRARNRPPNGHASAARCCPSAPTPGPLWTSAQAARIKSPEVSLHFDRAEARTLDLRPALRNVRCPTLVVQGEHDPLIPVRLGEEIVAGIPDGLGRLEVIPDAAHHVETDNPAATFGVIRDFVTGLPTPQPGRSGHRIG